MKCVQSVPDGNFFGCKIITKGGKVSFYLLLCVVFGFEFEILPSVGEQVFTHYIVGIFSKNGPNNVFAQIGFQVAVFIPPKTEGLKILNAERQ